MVERFNQTLLSMMTTYVNKEQDNWDLYLPIVTAAYRSTVHESTGYSANQLMFGREVNLPIHFLMGLPVQARQDISSYTDYVIQLNNTFCKIYGLVRQNLKSNATRQKRDYDTRIAFHSYSVGDIIYILDSSRIIGKSPKLKREIWKGPLVVIRKISDILYEIKGAPKIKPKIIHHDRMRHFNSSSIPQWVLSLQQSLKTDNTFAKDATNKTVKVQKSNVKQLNNKVNNDRGSSENIQEGQVRRGQRLRKEPERLQL